MCWTARTMAGMVTWRGDLVTSMTQLGESRLHVHLVVVTRKQHSAALPNHALPGWPGG